MIHGCRGSQRRHSGNCTDDSCSLRCRPGAPTPSRARRHVRDVLVSLPEANSALVGLLFWVGFRRELVAYPRVARASGKSGWTLERKLRYAFDTAFAFSDLPITTMVCCRCSGHQRIDGGDRGGVGRLDVWRRRCERLYAGHAGAIVSFSTTLLALGIIGGYVWRIFENTKGQADTARALG